MPIENIQDWIDQVRTATPAQRQEIATIIRAAVNLPAITDAITAGNREQKEAFAVLIGQADDFLRNTQAAAQQALTDAAIAAMITLLQSTVLPLLTPRNIADTLIVQHLAIVGNIRILETQLTVTHSADPLEQREALRLLRTNPTLGLESQETTLRIIKNEMLVIKSQIITDLTISLGREPTRDEILAEAIVRGIR